MNTRTCPHPACQRRIPATTFACRAHWFSIPASIRGEIDAAWQALGLHSDRHVPYLDPAEKRRDLARLRRAQRNAAEYWATEPPPDPRRKLIRQERTGTIHEIEGAVVRSRGRKLATCKRCGAIIAGTPIDGRLSEVTCTAKPE